jgi:hypothetical protein
MKLGTWNRTERAIAGKAYFITALPVFALEFLGTFDIHIALFLGGQKLFAQCV